MKVDNEVKIILLCNKTYHVIAFLDHISQNNDFLIDDELAELNTAIVDHIRSHVQDLFGCDMRKGQALARKVVEDLDLLDSFKQRD
jgi:hypothetical protein